MFGSNQEVEEVAVVVVEDLVLRDFLLDLDVFFEVDLDRFVELIVVFRFGFRMEERVENIQAVFLFNCFL